MTRSVDKAETSFRRLAQNGGSRLRTLKTLAAGVRSEFDRLKNFGSSVNGRLAGLGIGLAVGQQFGSSAQLDRQMIRTQQTAGMSASERSAWREEGFRIAKQYGVDADAIYAGGDSLLANGLTVKAAFSSADAIGQATAVTGANSEVLAGALTTGASSYDMNLEQAGVALDMLQKMTVAGRLGSAELENLSDIFPKMGSKAKAAGMSFAQSLAFVETLSKLERQPDRLGTLAESTLRVFNNGQYRDQVTKTTGIKFFNADQSARNPQEVLGDLRRKYGAMKSDEQRAKFTSTVFKGMDLDTQRGLAFLLQGDNLATFSEQTNAIDNADQPFRQDLKDNTASATGATSRVRSTLREAMDRMAQPVNKALADAGTYLLDDLNLSGGELLAGGLVAGVGSYYTGRGAKAGAGALLNKFLGGSETLKNVAVGKALEEATGVTSVFVTNWPANLGGAGLPDLPGGKKPSGPGGVVAPWLAPAALGLAATQLGGDSDMTDEGQLRSLSRNKLISEPQRQYLTAFYQNRMDLARQVPEGLSYGERENWLSSNATRLAQQQTGLTYSGGSVASGNAWAAGLANRLLANAFNPPEQTNVAGGSGPGAASNSWAAGVANRLTAAALTPPGQSAAPGAAESRLAQLLGKPLVVEIRTDSQMITAEVERRTDILMRRGQ